VIGRSSGFSPVLARDPGQAQKNRIRVLDSIFSHFAQIEKFVLFLCNILIWFMRKGVKTKWNKVSNPRFFLLFGI
jgi:hypothetical protein